MYRLRLVATLSMALLLSACAVPMRTSLTPEQRGKISELTAHVVVVQDATLLGQVVVVETDTEEVLIKRLLRGSRPGVYDLESVAGPMRHDARLRWAAHITAIIPPFQARRIIRGVA